MLFNFYKDTPAFVQMVYEIQLNEPYRILLLFPFCNFHFLVYYKMKKEIFINNLLENKRKKGR